MNIWKALVILGTVIITIVVSTPQTTAQTHPGVVTNANQGHEVVGSHGGQHGNVPGMGRAIPPYPAPGAAVQPYSGESASQWPNYPYSQYNNPYYDGGNQGNLVSGLIDWALAFPSSTWDRLSEFLDNNLFPRSPATYGGQPAVREVAPNNKTEESPELPTANPYSPGGR